MSRVVLENNLRRDWPYVFRIVVRDASGQLYANTGGLVSDKGKSVGYGITTSHAFGRNASLGTSGKDQELDDAWLMPYGYSVSDCRAPKGPVTVVNPWSNPKKDFAILKIPRRVIDEFRLRPAPVSYNIHRGMRLLVVGGHRPGELLYPDCVSVKVTKSADVFKDLEGGLRVFEVESVDPTRAIPWDTGMSGAVLLEESSLAVVGIAALVAPNDTGSHHYRGYAVPLSTVAQTWTTLDDLCRVVSISEDGPEQSPGVTIKLYTSKPGSVILQVEVDYSNVLPKRLH